MEVYCIRLNLFIQIREPYRVRCVLMFFGFNVKFYAACVVYSQQCLIDIARIHLTRNSYSKILLSVERKVPRTFHQNDLYNFQEKQWIDNLFHRRCYNYLTNNTNSLRLYQIYTLIENSEIQHVFDELEIAEMILDLQERSLVNCLRQMFKVY